MGNKPTNYLRVKPMIKFVGAFSCKKAWAAKLSVVCLSIQHQRDWFIHLNQITSDCALNIWSINSVHQNTNLYGLFQNVCMNIRKQVKTSFSCWASSLSNRWMINCLHQKTLIDCSKKCAWIFRGRSTSNLVRYILATLSILCLAIMQQDRGDQFFRG